MKTPAKVRNYKWKWIDPAMQKKRKEKDKATKVNKKEPTDIYGRTYEESWGAME